MNTLRAEKTSFYASANTDPRPPHGQARQYHARLLIQEGRRYRALTDEGAIWTLAAAGRRLQPAVGDIALVIIMNGTGYVLTVLGRDDDSQVAGLAMEGDHRPHGT